MGQEKLGSRLLCKTRFWRAGEGGARGVASFHGGEGKTGKGRAEEGDGRTGEG